MKFLTIAATLLMATSAFAVNQNSSWAEIFATGGNSYSANYALVGGASLDNTCVTQSTVESIHPVAVCHKYGPVPAIGGGEAPNYGEGAPCLQPGLAIVVADRTRTVPTCEEFKQPLELFYPECAKPGSKSVRVPDVVNVTVGLNEGSFTKAYALPDCATARRARR